MNKPTIRLRKINKKELSLLRDWRNSSKSFEYSGQFKLLNMADQYNWFNQLSQKNLNRIVFMIMDNHKKALGTCSLTNIDRNNKSAEVGIMIGDINSQGKGYGKESLRKILDYGFNNINLHRIEAKIFEFNKISLRLFERLNFKYESTSRESLWRNKKWWDIYVYSILSNEFN